MPPSASDDEIAKRPFKAGVSSFLRTWQEPGTSAGLAEAFRERVHRRDGNMPRLAIHRMVCNQHRHFRMRQGASRPDGTSLANPFPERFNEEPIRRRRFGRADGLAGL
jgi:hypothetical protein